MYVQIVESALVNSWNKIKAIADLDGGILLNTPKRIKDCVGEATVHDLQLSQLPSSSIRTLTSTTSVLTFDFSGNTKLEKSQKVTTKVKCTQTGLAQAVFMWWDLKIDINHKSILSCAPYWDHPDLSFYNERNSD